MTDKEIEALYQDITDLKNLKSFINMEDSSILSVTMAITFATKFPTTFGLDLRNMPGLQKIIYDDISSYAQKLEDKLKTLRFTIKGGNITK